MQESVIWKLRPHVPCGTVKEAKGKKKAHSAPSPVLTQPRPSTTIAELHPSLSVPSPACSAPAQPPSGRAGMRLVPQAVPSRSTQ